MFTHLLVCLKDATVLLILPVSHSHQQQLPPRSDVMRTLLLYAKCTKDETVVQPYVYYYSNSRAALDIVRAVVLKSSEKYSLSQVSSSRVQAAPPHQPATTTRVDEAISFYIPYAPSPSLDGPLQVIPKSVRDETPVSHMVRRKSQIIVERVELYVIILTLSEKTLN